MLCTDDTSLFELTQVGHIDNNVKKLLKHGCKIFNVLKAACINPVLHYKLPIGLLKKGDLADFVVVKGLSAENFEIQQTWING